jgi:hypothetical protein
MCLVLSMNNMYENGKCNRRKVHSLKTLSHCFLMLAQLLKNFHRVVINNFLNLDIRLVV